MATAGTIVRESVGSLTLFMIPFTAITDNDTYASGLSTNVKGYWFNSTKDCTAGNEGVNVSDSSGTFTFITKEPADTGTLYILATV